MNLVNIITNKMDYFIDYYIKDNIIYFNLEDICYALGYVFKERNNRKLYIHIRWNRVNKYLREFGVKTRLHKGDYISETLLYRLLEKSKTEKSLRFKKWICEYYIPEIRMTDFNIPNKDGILRIKLKIDPNKKKK